MDSTLTRITQTGADGKPAVGGVKISYGYAPDGLLLSRAPAGGQVEHVTWNRLAGISRMLAPAGTEFVYGLGQAPIVQTTAGKADSGGLVWLHTDHLGSVVATTDTAGGVSSASGWGVYGGETNASGSGKRVSSVSVFGFAGEYTDPVSGLVYLRAHWLDPTRGWFLSVDPLVAVSGEPYLYAAGSPEVLTDPTGLRPGRGFTKDAAKGAGQRVVGVLRSLGRLGLMLVWTLRCWWLVPRVRLFQQHVQ